MIRANHRHPQYAGPTAKSVVLLAIVLVLGLWGGACNPAALAQPAVTPATALERLFVAEALQDDWFAPVFLSQVPLEQVEILITQLRTSLGRLQQVEGTGPDYRVTFDRGSLPAHISLDAEGRISGLFFGPPQMAVAGLEDALAAFTELPGQVSVLVMRDGSELAAIHPDEPLAVGSAFKLAVLAALRQQIEAGQRAWDDVVLLEESWPSLPSGILQNWPVGSPLTLHTLAALMISWSDNSATDALIHTLGREAVEAFSLRNRPLLTTREFFMLKAPANKDVLEQYRASDEAGRRTVLAGAQDRPLPGPDIGAAPRALDVEWFFTTRELCALMGVVDDLPLMSVNPGVANPEDWEWVAYKGGAEPGVLNLTTALIDDSGHRYCVSATWNDTAELDELHFYGLYSGLLEALRQPGSTPQ